MLIQTRPDVLVTLQQGKSVGVKEVPGVKFVVTRLGLATLDELRPHPGLHSSEKANVVWGYC